MSTLELKVGTARRDGAQHSGEIGMAASARTVWKRLGAVWALRGVTLDIARGERVALMGPNGAGKSTLLRVLATLARPTRGTVSVLGSERPDREPGVRGRIGLVGHEPMLYRDLTALENLELFARLHGLGDARNRAREWLDRVGITARTDAPVRTLSRGTAQRAAVARALIHNPDLLLADEPFTGLDASGAALVAGLLAEQSARGVGWVITEHDPRVALGLGARAVVLRFGSVMLDLPAGAASEAVVRAAIGGEA